MNWFEDFGEFTWFTIAMLAVALVGGIFALIKRDRTRLIMTITCIAEAAIVVVALITFFRSGSAEGSPFEGVSISAAMFSLLIAVLVIAMVAIMIIAGRKEKWGARDIAYAAMCVAMSFILSSIKLYTMPQGGTITPASLLPMMIYIVAFGPARGLAVGFAYGLIQLLQGAYVVHPLQLLVDYPMAFGALALGGVVHNMKMSSALKLPVAVVLGYIGRYVMAVLSGAVFFAEYAGEQNAWIYSLGYNITYLGPDCLVCVIVSLIPGMAGLTERIRKVQ